VAEAKKSPVRKAVRRKKTTVPAPEAVAERAYYIALEQGGQPFDNWLQAERELARV
jgi:hypothetical protein